MWFVFAILALSCQFALAAVPKTVHAFCVVGAGPGGVQLGHFLSKSKDVELQDYVVFERAPAAGHFFRKYPKHRELISINKRHLSPGHGPDYAFRQDWNSLIGRPEVTPVTQRTKNFFPDADIVADYIEEFASEQFQAGKIQLNTSVESIKKVATGFEAILPMAASVHMIGHSEARFSDQTHYPGDVRANRREILDHYQLKMTSTIRGLAGREALIKCFEGKLCFLLETEVLEFFVNGEGHEAGMEVLHMLANKTAQRHITKDEEWTHEPAGRLQRLFDEHLVQNRKARSMYAELRIPKEVVPSADWIAIKRTALLRSENKDLLDLVLKHRFTMNNHGARDTFDVAIRCTGWKHNMTIYDESAKPKLLSNLKHAAVTDSYESVNVSGLFFAGTLAHGPDFRRSAGGFIHGFRYTARALSRILEFQRGHGWGGQKKYQLPQEMKALQEHMLWRIRESSGPYHMFDELVEGVIFSAENCTASYVEEVPKAFFHNTFKEMPRLDWVFNYAPPGFQRDIELDESAAQYHQRGYNDPFLHPILRFFDSSGSSTVEPAKASVHIHADFFTRWISETTTVSIVRRFLEYSIRESFGETLCSTSDASAAASLKDGSCAAAGGCAAAEEEAAKASVLSRGSR